MRVGSDITGMDESARPLRIGSLGCADILRESLLDIRPYGVPVELAAVAARDPARARAFAAEHGIPRWHASYEALLADPAIDVVYVPLPNSLHAAWSIRALQAGKPVLCQKPVAANAQEAQQIAAAVRATGLLFMEAWHYRHHPVARRIGAIVRSGVLGRLRHAEARFQVPGAWVTAGPDNIRFSHELAGGAMMDPGCYCVNLLRYVTGEEPRVLRASARLHSAQVDSAMEADLLFPGGCEGRLLTALDYAGDALDERLLLRGDAGELEVIQPCMPHWGEHRIRLRTADGESSEQLDRASGFVQLFRDLVAIVRHGAPNPAPIADGIATLRVIDAIYCAAGMRPRGS